jgi:hypothetical protein
MLKLFKKEIEKLKNDIAILDKKNERVNYKLEALESDLWDTKYPFGKIEEQLALMGKGINFKPNYKDAITLKIVRWNVQVEYFLKRCGSNVYIMLKLKDIMEENAEEVTDMYLYNSGKAICLDAAPCFENPDIHGVIPGIKRT